MTAIDTNRLADVSHVLHAASRLKAMQLGAVSVTNLRCQGDSMAALPYMSFYPADYLADTLHLSTEEHGAYLLLIMHYWQTGRPIPKNRLAMVAKLSQDRWEEIEGTLAEFFTEDKKGSWKHKRIEKELKKVREKVRANSKAGKSSAKARSSQAAETKKEKGQRPFNDRSTTVPTKIQPTDKNRTDNKNIKPPSIDLPPMDVANKKFRRPKVDEVRQYCAERKNGIDPVAFVNFYDSKGWVIGKSPMKCWKAAVITWEKRAEKTPVAARKTVDEIRANLRASSERDDDQGEYIDGEVVRYVE